MCLSPFFLFTGFSPRCQLVKNCGRRVFLVKQTKFGIWTVPLQPCGGSYSAPVSYQVSPLRLRWETIYQEAYFYKMLWNTQLWDKSLTFLGAAAGPYVFIRLIRDTSTPLLVCTFWLFLWLMIYPAVAEFIFPCIVRKPISSRQYYLGSQYCPNLCHKWGR